MARASVALFAVILLATSVLGQTPQPFPRPGAPQQDPPRPATAPPQAPAPKSPAQPGPAPADTGAPDAATIYFPLHPTAQFIRSYDAGRGQRYYIYATTAPYVELVAYYRTQLRERGDQVFVEPPTHMFAIGRFREETMAFPPGVTVKDWTWGGSPGYPNPRGSAAQPARFPSVLMIVPPPPGTPPLER
ncbi:MAG TPA: hypothetical protein VIX63_09805 [Vicinamibacterales bacterium]